MFTKYSSSGLEVLQKRKGGQKYTKLKLDMCDMTLNTFFRQVALTRYSRGLVHSTFVISQTGPETACLSNNYRTTQQHYDEDDNDFKKNVPPAKVNAIRWLGRICKTKMPITFYR